MKWIEVKSLATITTKKVQKLLWKNVVCKFSIPQTLVTDNGRRSLVAFYEGLDIHHITSSVEHSQTNLQAGPLTK